MGTDRGEMREDWRIQKFSEGNRTKESKKEELGANGLWDTGIIIDLKWQPRLNSPLYTSISNRPVFALMLHWSLILQRFSISNTVIAMAEAFHPSPTL